MALKENKEISFYGKLPLIFFLCCAATMIIRTVQVFSSVDRETGFYTGNKALVFILYFLIAAASVLFAVSSFLSKESAKVELRAEKNTLLSVLSCVLSVGFLYDSASAFFGTFDSADSVSYGASAFQSMMLSGTIPQFFQSVFALLSAAYFLVLAKDAVKGSNKVSSRKILAVAPVCWAGFRLVHRFVEQISYIRVSELLLELVMLALMIMFFMAFAQVASGVYVKNARWRIVGLGLPAALVSLTVNVPRLLFVLANGTDELYSKYPFKVSDFVIALFIAVLVIKIINNKSEAAEA